MWLFVSFFVPVVFKDLAIRNVDVLKVPEAGVEPAPSYEDMTLNHARLPIPPPGHYFEERLQI